MKKIIYIVLTSFLGFLLGLLVHVVIEMPYLYLLQKDFYKWSLGISMPQLYLIHTIFTLVLSVAGILFGIWLGFKWYKVVYLKK